jgi:hypothetical protein
MAKLERLKWIPMLVKAYTEARIRSDTGAAQSVQNTVVSKHTDESAEGASIPLTEVVHTPKKTPKVRSTPQNHRRRTARPVNTHAEKPMTHGKSTHWNSSHIKQYQFMMQELRETKRKLERLESIDSRLDEIDRYIGQLKEVMKTTEINQGENIPQIENKRS